MTQEQSAIDANWHSASHLMDFHIQITAVQKAEIEKHCQLYNKSQGRFTREAINYLLGFYSNLRREQEAKK